MPLDQLEPDLAEPFKAWKAQPTQATNAAMLKALGPTIEGAVRTHVGQADAVTFAKARGMAIQGLGTYDPRRGKLKTHVYNHLQGLKRAAVRRDAIVRVPDRVMLENYKLNQAESELTHRLGREPTDDELADHTGLPHARLARARTYVPGIPEAAAPEGGFSGGMRIPGGRSPWAELIYDGLDDYHKKVFEYTLGTNGRQPLPNHEIARRLGRSPGAVSQAKLRIQRQLDDESELSPFGR